MTSVDEYFPELVRRYKQDLENKNPAYENISIHLEELKEEHRKLLSPEKDFEQSWRGIKGRLLERIVQLIIKEGLEELKLGFASDVEVRDLKEGAELYSVKEQLEISYSQGKLIPDADIIAYDLESYRVLAVISCKATLRERVAQAAYWNLKTHAKDPKSKIKYFLVTTDEDKDFAAGGSSRNRIIAEGDTDGVFVMSESVKEGGKIFRFSRLIEELEELASQDDPN